MSECGEEAVSERDAGLCMCTKCVYVESSFRVTVSVTHTCGAACRCAGGVLSGQTDGHRAGREQI